MKIAIHYNKMHFSQGWIDYCKENEIDFKIVDCYDTNIIEKLRDFDILMWHHDHINSKDTRFAKQLLFSLEMAGKIVFPDFRTNWHFDDKLGQKYLLEAIDAPMVASYAFYSKIDALRWAKGAIFPKVFKLRGGSGSDNVRLVKTRKDAVKLIKKAFGTGFSRYNSWGSLKERWRKYRAGKEKLKEVFDGIFRLIIPTPYSYIQGRDRGYIYFQDFISNNTHDIRVTYVNNKCFALRRKVRPADFRASGGGMIEYDMSQIPIKALRIAFDVATQLTLQTAAFDFVVLNGEPKIIEMSYGFGYDEDQYNHGYWDNNLNYYPGTFNPYGWMIEGLIEEHNRRNQY